MIAAGNMSGSRRSKADTLTLGNFTELSSLMNFITSIPAIVRSMGKNSRPKKAPATHCKILNGQIAYERDTVHHYKSYKHIHVFYSYNIIILDVLLLLSA